MITKEHFTATLAGLQELLPLGKTLSEPALKLAWALFPLQAKTELELEQLLFAVQQRVLDPEPAAEQAITQQLLRYLYPLQNGQPVVDRGLRPDLAERMQQPEVFHPLQQLAEHRPAPEVMAQQRLGRLAPVLPAMASPAASFALPAGGAGGGAVGQVQLATRPLLLAARAVVDAAPGPACPFTPEQLATGALLAAGSLVGRWTLEQIRPADGRPCLAEAWIRTHPHGWAAMQMAAWELRAASAALCRSGSRSSSEKESETRLVGAGRTL